MTPRKLSVTFATFPYGGNGASAREHPDVRDWLVNTIYKTRQDARIDQVFLEDYSDTPITMTRNKAVVGALEHNIDVLVMIDSDQKPDMYLGIDPEAEPFWDVAFDFLYDHWEKGPVCIAAPYSGGPPVENTFCFEWRKRQSDHSNLDADFHLSQYTREEAVGMRGIQPCAALPTGLSMFDTRLFQMSRPSADTFGEQVRRWMEPYTSQAITKELIDEFVQWAAREKYRREQSWFYYEYTDETQSEKASSEDVAGTRDLSLIGVVKLGYNPVHCAWSSWAGHWKPKCVGKPQLMTPENVGVRMARAAREAAPETLRQIEASEAIRLSKHRAPIDQPAFVRRNVPGGS